MKKILITLFLLSSTYFSSSYAEDLCSPLQGNWEGTIIGSDATINNSTATASYQNGTMNILIYGFRFSTKGLKGACHNGFIAAKTINGDWVKGTVSKNSLKLTGFFTDPKSKGGDVNVNINMKKK